MKLKKGTLKIFVGIILLEGCFIMTGCSDKKDIYNMDSFEESNYSSSNSENNSSNVEINSSKIESSSFENSDADNETNDDIIINYYKEEEQEIDEMLEGDSGIKDKISEKVITLVDFLFYDGEIKGITLDEISNDAKETVLGILNKIDVKIESKFPDYKESISDKTSSALNWLKEKVHNGAIKIDDFLNRKLDHYDEIKDFASSFADQTKDDFGEVKDLITDGVSKIKDKYEDFRNSKKNG